MASAGDDYAGDDLEALADLPAYQEWILHLFRPHLKGKVVEIGAGLGNIASRYADGVDDLLLVEPAKNLYPRLKERFDGKPNVRTICALVESLDPVAGVVSPAMHHATTVTLVLLSCALPACSKPPLAPAYVGTTTEIARVQVDLGPGNAPGVVNVQWWDTNRPRGNVRAAVTSAGDRRYRIALPGCNVGSRIVPS